MSDEPRHERTEAEQAYCDRLIEQLDRDEERRQQGRPTYHERLLFARRRAQAYLDRGDATGAMTSFLSDVNDYPEAAGLQRQVFLAGMFDAEAAMRQLMAQLPRESGTWAYPSPLPPPPPDRPQATPPNRYPGSPYSDRNIAYAWKYALWAVLRDRDERERFITMEQTGEAGRQECIRDFAKRFAEASSAVVEIDVAICPRSRNDRIVTVWLREPGQRDRRFFREAVSYEYARNIAPEIAQDDDLLPPFILPRETSPHE